MAFANEHFNSSVKIEHQFVKMGNERSLCIKETQLPHRQHIRQPAASFRDLVRNSNVYVDKSLLVSWILEHESVLSLTYPPQWGKSIALSMLYEFFALHVDSEGKAMEPNNDSWAYRYFKLGQIMHDNGNVEKLKKTPSVANSESFADIVDRRRKKEINKQKFTRENETGESEVSQSVANGNSIIDQHLGKYPIIHIDLSNLQPAVNNLYRFFEAFCELIGELYERHDYMIDILKEIVSHNEPIRGTSVTQVKAMLKKYETYLYRKESSHDEMYSSLEFLSRILNWHFQTKVFIFIDNYDYWAKGVYVAAGSQQAPYIYNFISSFMTRTLKNNQYIRNAVLTGTLGFKICFPQPALSGVVDYSLLEKNTCFAFGFTEEEVVQLLDITGRSITLAKEWYGGYNIISEDYEPKAVLYNPWSIVNFVNKGRIDTYWCDMKSINILAEIMRYGKISQLFRILTCYNDYVEVDRETLSLNSFNSVEMFSNIVTLLFSDNISSNFQITTDTYNAIISVLYAYGYLSLTEDSPLSSSSTKYQLQLPNEEIKNEILNVHQSTYFYCTYVPDMKKIQKIYTSLVKFVKCEGKNLRLKRDLENDLNEFRSWMNSIWGNGKTKYWNKSAPHNAPFLISLLVMMNHDNQAQWTMFQQNESDPEHQYFVFFYKNEYCIVFEQRYFYEDQTRLHISWEDNMKVRAKQELLGKCDFVLPMNRLQICRISG